jgi:hypothetical protein
MRKVCGWMQWSFRGGVWACSAAGDFWMVLSADYCCCGLLSSVRWMRKSWLVLLPAVEECFAEETGQWTKKLDAWKVFGRREKDSTYSIGSESLRVHTACGELGFQRFLSWRRESERGKVGPRLTRRAEWRGRVEMEVEGTRRADGGRDDRGDVFVQICNNDGMEESWEGAGGEGVLSLARSMGGSGQVNSSHSSLVSLAVGGETASRRQASMVALTRLGPQRFTHPCSSGLKDQGTGRASLPRRTH